jgi:hypothetical protein
MQIHEITAIQEGLGTMLKTIGSDLKGAVKAPFQKAKYLMKEPGSLTSTGAYNNARDKYYTDLVGARQSEKAASTTTDLTAWAKNLASEWSRQPRPSLQTTVTQPPVTPATPKSTVAPTPTPATTAPVATPGYGPAYKNVTSNPPAAVPNTSTGLPQPTTAKTPTVATTPTAATKPTVAAKSTPDISTTNPGGRVNPYMNVPAAPETSVTAPGQNAFGQMAQTLSGANKSKSSTGGTTTQTPTGRVHTANTATTATTAKAAPKWLTPTTKISKSANPGLPTTTEYEKLQQRIAAADAKQRGVTNEAFGDLPGTKPAVGGVVPASVTAKPAGTKAPPPLQSRYAQNFRSWVTSKVADKSSGLGLADVEKMPEMTRALNQALAKVVTTQQNPNDNIAAVEQYLLMVGQAMQKLSAEQKSTQQQNNPGRRSASYVTPLSSIVNDKQIEALKNMAKDPTGAYDIKTTLGLR